MLVVSAETQGGGTKVNQVRQQYGLAPLKVHSVELIPDERFDEEEEDKVSSSNERLRLLGTLIFPPEVDPSIMILFFVYYRMKESLTRLLPMHSEKKIWIPALYFILFLFAVEASPSYASVHYRTYRWDSEWEVITK